MLVVGGDQMKLYLNELAPWERKDEYFRHIQLGKDVKSQTAILQDAINNQTRAQLASSSAIIASQERISEGLGELSVGFDRIEQGIESLQATFEWGISEVVWQIEQNREVLKNILEILMSPIDTQAKERRKRAEKAFSNGWIEDAEEELLESERLNRYDFAIHISLGMIYLFHKIDKNKAFHYFEKAIKYATPESQYYTAYALLYKALIKRDLGQIDEAEKCTSDAIRLCPKFAEAIFQNAQYNALQGKQGPAITSLQKAIELDLTYCLKADSGEEFNGIRGQVSNLFYTFQQNENRKAYKRWEKLEKKLTFISKLTSRVDEILGNQEFSSKCNQSAIRNELSKIKQLINRESIFDARKANLKLNSLEKNISRFISDAREQFRDVIGNEKSASRKYKRYISYDERQRRDLPFSFLKAIPAGIGLGLIVGIIPAKIVENNSSTFAGLVIWTLIIIIIYGFVVKTKFDDEDHKFWEIPADVNKRLRNHEYKVKQLEDLNFDKVETI